MTGKVEYPIEPTDEELYKLCMKNSTCKLLAEVGYYEARNQKHEHHVAAVMWVALNRVKSPRFKENDLRQVIYKPRQFTYTEDGSMKKGFAEREAYKRVAAIAKKVVTGKIPDITDGADHYHTTSVKPRWNWRKLEDRGVLGDHVFYRYKEG